MSLSLGVARIYTYRAMTTVLPYRPPSAPAPSTLLQNLDTCSVLQAALATSHNHQLVANPTKRGFVGLGSLPEELLTCIVQNHFDVSGLCTLAQVSPRFRHLSSLEEPWQQLYKQKFGEVNSVVREAANLAKTWKELYKCKLATNKRADPWLTPCVYELAAIHQRIVEAHPSDQAAGGVVFLLDGSGSVFQDDFKAMTDFVSKTFQELMQANTKSKVGVIQFSTGINVHLPLDSYSADTFGETIDNMARMNGGTNLASAIDTANSMMKEKLPIGSPRTVIILTDGRIDSYQGEETVRSVKRINEEQGNLSVYAFGIGCGVGRAELLNIVSATGCADADCHYMALAVHPDPDYRW